MVVTDLKEFRRNAEMGCPVKIVLSDHHYWGGLRATQRLALMCETFGLGLSMHSNSHLGISLTAMTHLAASVPLLSYACDTHYPWQDDEVVQGGRLKFEGRQPGRADHTRPGRADRPRPPWPACTTTTCRHDDSQPRNDLAQMRKVRPLVHRSAATFLNTPFVAMYTHESTHHAIHTRKTSSKSWPPACCPSPLTDFDANGDFNAKGYAARLEWLAPYGASCAVRRGRNGRVLLAVRR